MQFETLAYGYEFLECPRVDAENRLYFSCSRNGVFRRDLSGNIQRLFERTWVGGLALNRGGGLLVSGKTLALWNERDHSLKDIISEFEGSPIPGFNDLVVDRAGNVFVGVMGFDINTFDPSRAKPPPGSLFRVSPTGVATRLHDGIMVPNGIGFSPDGKLLYLSDTMTHAVWVFDVTADHGVRDRRVFHHFADDELPDGLAVDVEGCVWVAVAKGKGEVVRLRADGTIERRVKVPSTFVTSVGFGGADLTELYVVTADNSEEPSRNGTVFRTRVDVPGLPMMPSQF
jgi:gluconolactonase